MNKVIIFDTTMRDGELIPGVKMNQQQKISISQLLEEMRVDIIEVGYPGSYQKDFEEVFQISKLIKNYTICRIASANQDEIITLAEALKPAKSGREFVDCLKLWRKALLYVRLMVWVRERGMQIYKKW